ncbi:hypothetical protein [Nocardia farcinica]|uniref:hypothetical protein n=1 Tax=Nocardia farcinica TaxID=37329 RepID=UPI00245534E3|nr:hypothetical protein [Nocardia farcinica]
METPGAGDDSSKVTRLPRRPRRVTEEPGARPRRAWLPETGYVFDPAPTKPVLRSELQRETGWWPVTPATDSHPAPESGQDREGDVIDLDSSRRRRSGG